LFTGDLTTTGKLTAKYIDVQPQIAGSSEGGEIKLTSGGGYSDVYIDNYDGNARIHTLTPGKKFQVLGGSGIESAGGYTINADNRWNANDGLLVHEAINIKKGTIEVADTTTILASNDNWIPYPGDEAWQQYTSAQKLKWSRQVPNAYTVAKMIGNVLEPFTQQIKDLAQ
jgi:hypothetical protein